METMEEEREAILGTAETRGARVDGKAVSRLRRPLPSGRKDHRTAPHQQRNPRKARTSQLCRLLPGLNRRMPNGTYGGVKGATS